MYSKYFFFLGSLGFFVSAIIEVVVYFIKNNYSSGYHPIFLFIGFMVFAIGIETIYKSDS